MVESIIAGLYDVTHITINMEGYLLAVDKP